MPKARRHGGSLRPYIRPCLRESSSPYVGWKIGTYVPIFT